MLTKIKKFFSRLRPHFVKNNPFKIKLKGNDKKAFWKKFRFYGLRALIGLAALIILLFIWYAKDLPTPGNIKNRQAMASTQLFDRNGKPIYAVHGDVKRTLIEDKDIPLYAKQATIVIEDRNFYKHHGFDFKGIARALYYNITGKKGYTSGGSTITQQFVKNALLSPKKTMTRKIKELILTIEIEIMYNKEQILTMYFNEIPYGSNAYGIEAASGTYFNKHAKDLTLAEAATLAALPQRPTYYSPYGAHPDKRLLRVNYILDSMANLNYISKEDAEKAKAEAKDIKFAEPHEYIVAPHFAMYVKEKLVEKYGEQMVEEGGLKVTTTLDLDKQVKAEEAIAYGKDRTLDDINASNASLVSLDPKTGQILAMVGSIDYFNNDIDGQVNVADSLRQPGSSFKPIVYATAFKGKYNPAYTLWDVTTDFGNYTPKNYDGSTHGPVSMRKALAGSLNIPAVKTLYLAGIENSIKTAHDMGITSLNEKDRYGLALVLGGGEVKLVDLTTAYGVFANQGKIAPTTPILKVVDSKGKTLDEYKEGKDVKEALDPQVAYEISSILSDNEARSYVFGSNSALNIPDHQVAVKTGTTSEYRDAWTVGYTPSVVTGVWVGNNDNTPMTAGAAGAMAAAPIWNHYMNSVLGENEDFVRPKGIEDVTVDVFSNKLPSTQSPSTISDIFTSWQVPKTYDDIHLALRIDRYSGNRASDDCPDEFVEIKVYTNLHSEVPDNSNWEYPVRAAAEGYGIYVSYPPEETSCIGRSGKPSINITNPGDNSTVGNGFLIQAEVNSPVNVSKVEFYIDDVSIGSDTSAPYSKSAPGLSSGKHTITVVVTNDASLTASAKITVNVTKDNNPPGNVQSVNISPGSGSISLSWKNPSDSDLTNVRIYGSLTQGQLGSILQTADVSPSSNSSTSIGGLGNGKKYYITLRTVDGSGNEGNDNNQYSTTTL